LGITQFSYFGDGILFADGTNVPPKESRATDHYCPFNESEADTFRKGIILIYIIAFVHLACTGCITVYVWKKFWDHRIKPLASLHMFGMNDFVVMTIVVIEFF
jgi:hypothetical protein